jgi:protein-S-isoprenylcysteine O-methyltransferase Ste14
MENRAQVKVLPPVVLVAALCIGALVSKLVPSAMLPPRASSTVGTLIIVASLIIARSAFREIRRAGTSLDIRKPTTALVTTGVFRFTRNPIYLSMVLVYVGVAFLLNSFWMLVLSIATGVALFRLAIKPEEQYLEAKFGDAYRVYRGKVRRWI